MIITLISVICRFSQKKVMTITLISNILSVICWFPQKISDDNHSYFSDLSIFAWSILRRSKCHFWEVCLVRHVNHLRTKLKSFFKVFVVFFNLRCDNTTCLISRRRSILRRFKVHFWEVCFVRRNFCFQSQTFLEPNETLKKILSVLALTTESH